MTLSEIAHLVEGEFAGSTDTVIERVAKIEDAGPGDITFLANLKYKKHLATTKASAILIAQNVQFDELEKRSVPIQCIRVSDPYSAFLKLIDVFHPAPIPLPKGIHPTAVVPPSATIGSDVAIGAHVVLGERCTIENGVSVHHGSVLGDDVRVGTGSILYSNVTIREQCIVGNRVNIHSGTVIGSDGFGFALQDNGRYEKIPQRGIVVIEDDVEIGANCAIDRATIGETRIGRGTKLDNLIHVAHNVVIGENTVIAAQTGISGSTKIGNNCMIAGQVGFVGHIRIADRTTIGAQSGVPKSITESGKTYMGYPAREIHESWRIDGAARQLPELLREFRNLQKRVEELEQQLQLRSTSK